MSAADSTSLLCSIRVEAGLGVLDLAGGGGQNPAVVNWIDESRIKLNQQWVVELVPGSTSLVTIASRMGGRRVIANGSGKSVLCDPIGVDDQRAQWYFEGADLANYNGQVVRFRSVAYSGTYLDLNEGKEQNGTPFIVSDGHPGSNQAFKLFKK